MHQGTTDRNLYDSRAAPTGVPLPVLNAGRSFFRKGINDECSNKNQILLDVYKTFAKLDSIILE